MIILRSPKIEELNTLISFYNSEVGDGPEPGETQNKLFDTWAKIDNVWLKDLEMAKSNGTLSDITVVIRDSQPFYFPTNKHYLTIDAFGYADKIYNIKSVQPDLQSRQWITIVAGLKE